MIEKQLKDNTCKIICGKDQGTGFLISNKLILTAFHVVKKYEKEKIDIIFENNDKEFNVKLHELIDEKYKKLDIAILELDDFIENYNHIAIIDIPLNNTLKWQTRGYPSITSVAENILINDHTYINEQRSELHEQSDIHLNINKKLDDYSGFSGSPLIINNNVVGIIKKKFEERGVSKELRGLSNKYFKELLEKVGIRVHNNYFTPLNSKIGLVTQISEEDKVYIKRKLEENLNYALKVFSTQPTIFIEPKIHREEEHDNNNESKVSIKEILEVPKSLIIRAKQQYGLTSLSHYLIKEAWNNNIQPSFWLHLDANELKPHTSEIEKYVENKLTELKLSKKDVKCIILDEFSSNIKNATNLLKKVSDFFKNTSLILMYTEIDNPLLRQDIGIPYDREFETYYLWTLERTGIRQIVNKYNDKQHIGEADSVVNKIATDLEVLNIPRTPFNCLVILKISETNFDDTPINRTDMLSKILFLLFNVDDIPRYKSKPDLKNTEFVLGYFSEKMIRKNDYLFTREFFIKELNEFCSEELLNLEIDIVFDVLVKNNIIIERREKFCFKFRYWVLYFGSHRMHHNDEFRDYILEEMRYINYPEIIEFYTGINRRSNDAVKQLIDDISKTRNKVEEKCGLSSLKNIYDSIKWEPTDDDIKEMNQKVDESVEKSKLPESIKDQYADKSYSPTKAQDQSISEILEELSLLHLMKSVQAGARALRNSNFVSKDNKKKLLNEILRSWEQIIEVVLILVPTLSIKGYATLDGASFGLNGNFGKTVEERFLRIIPIIPANIVLWYQDDLFSESISPLFYHHINNEKDSSKLMKHTLSLLLITKRPINWEGNIKKYIESENKNSFYLLDIYKRLSTEQDYSFCSDKDLIAIENSIKGIVAKHTLGMPKPLRKKALERSEKIIIKNEEKDLDKEEKKNNNLDKLINKNLKKENPVRKFLSKFINLND